MLTGLWCRVGRDGRHTECVYKLGTEISGRAFGGKARWMSEGGQEVDEGECMRARARMRMCCIFVSSSLEGRWTRWTSKGGQGEDKDKDKDTCEWARW